MQQPSSFLKRSFFVLSTACAPKEADVPPSRTVRVEAAVPLESLASCNEYRNIGAYEKAASCYEKQRASSKLVLVEASLGLAETHLEQENWAYELNQATDAKSIEKLRAIEASVLLLLKDSLEPHKQSSIHAMLGRISLLRGDCTNAVRNFDEAVRLQPLLAERIGLRAVIHMQCTALDKALSDFQKARDLEPTSAARHRNLGGFLVMRKQSEAAIAVLRRALELDAQSAKAWNDLATAYVQLNKHQDAEASYQKALELAPQDPIVLVGLGFCKQQQGSFKEAEAFYKKAIRMDGYLRPAWINLTVVYAQQSLWKKADKALSVAEKLKIDERTRELRSLIDKNIK